MLALPRSQSFIVTKLTINSDVDIGHKLDGRERQYSGVFRVPQSRMRLPATTADFTGALKNRNIQTNNGSQSQRMTSSIICLLSASGVARYLEGPISKLSMTRVLRCAS